MLATNNALSVNFCHKMFNMFAFNHLISLTVFCQYFLPAPDYGFVSHYRCVNFDVLFCRKTFSSYWNCAQQLSI